MASNIADSTRIWNCKVKNPSEVIGPLGDLQHMKSYLGEGEILGAGNLFLKMKKKLFISISFINCKSNYRRNGLDY